MSIPFGGYKWVFKDEIIGNYCVIKIENYFESYSKKKSVHHLMHALFL